MNPEVDTGPTKAVWTVADVFKLLPYLIDQKPRAGDGGSYPMAIYNEAAVECNKIRSQGANKTGAMCKNKWSTGLRPIWKICREIDTRSGLDGFDTKKGAHISGESEHVWADFVKSNPSVAPYKHNGWVYWDKMAELLGSPPPRGHCVFCASQMIDTRAISPTWDIENENNDLPGDSQVRGHTTSFVAHI
ncbi:hypothetical protein BDP27DRAFT_1245522 [Rhodocollybia butyracea]|uniref:Myb-like domain-containing protein n=1 Tax=Rhodocollybia butyracea TaxID=206335 RepID=A0A9P5TV89_9AGAR|nr:hypothetical protein BDP27DRAFT_1245522 [Rhodocollybia butyracea]